MIDINSWPSPKCDPLLILDCFSQDILSGELSEVVTKVNELISDAGIDLVTRTVVTGTKDLYGFVKTVGGSAGRKAVAIIMFPQNMTMPEVERAQQTVFEVISKDAKLYSFICSNPGVCEMLTVLVAVDNNENDIAVIRN